MPKRFTVTEKWNDEWFISLSPQAKVIWEYMRDNCDLSGVWEVNLELMRYRIKFSPQVDIMKHMEELNEVAQKLGMEDRVEWFEDKRRIWIKNFIKVQYGILTFASSTHRGVIKVIENHIHTKGLPNGYITLQKGYLSLKNKNKVKVKVISKVNEKPINVAFEDFWNTYDKKVDRVECEKKWLRLTDKEREDVMEYIPKYKLAQPHKKYRKDPQTFLNNRGWENELVTGPSGVPVSSINDYMEQRIKDEERLKQKIG